MGKKRDHDTGELASEGAQKKRRQSFASSAQAFKFQGVSSKLSNEICQLHGPQDVSKSVDSSTASYSEGETASNTQDGLPALQEVSNITQNTHQNQNRRKSSREPDQSTGADGTSVSEALNFPVFRQSSPNAASSQHQILPATHYTPVYLRRDDGQPGKAPQLPPLPPIRDRTLTSVAFTHPACVHGTSTSKFNSSYDRLEFIGDAYIEVVATRIIFSRFPQLPAGRLSQQRELLVKNETLAEYALAYGFDEKASLPDDIRVPGKNSRKIWTKTMGDIFEAYVAALILSDPQYGFQTVEAWLGALWEPKLSSHRPQDTEMADLKAKENLSKKILGKGIKLDYREEAPREEIKGEGKIVYHIGVFLTGWGWENMRLGSGKGLSKQDAGAGAAKDALANPLSAQVASVKREFDQRVQRERKMQRDMEKAEEGKEEKGEGGNTLSSQQGFRKYHVLAGSV